MVAGHTSEIERVTAALPQVTDAKLKALLERTLPSLHKHADQAKALQVKVTAKAEPATTRHEMKERSMQQPKNPELGPDGNEIPDRAERDRAVRTRDAYGRDASGTETYGPDGRRIDERYGRDVMTGGEGDVADHEPGGPDDPPAGAPATDVPTEDPLPASEPPSAP